MFQIIINNFTRHSCTNRFRSIFARNVSAVANPTIKGGATTTLAKDIVIYKNENQKFIRLVSFFSLSQLGFWGFLSYSTLSLKDVPIPQDTEGLPFYKKINLGDDLHKKFLSGAYATIGYLIFTGGWIYVVRSIRYIILRKGGGTISLVSYHPSGRNAVMDVPINCVSASGSRAAKKSYIPIKVKGRRLFYMLDTDGTFPRPELFDRTVGVHRKFK
ncbi:unnamed protein product [Allacma fusca]|uniref:Transmembrane protein 223 n=1 Tax=Allacma fusca TaxID=39272 RepID=A0A8J2JSZ9_9HEXA|nr:unnamed protein product [Allacma fusca]